MTDLFIVLAAVTVVCTGAAIPCFFKSSRNIAGCLILSVAVLAATSACFATPVRDCFASISQFDIIYFSILFAAAFVISLFYRLLSGIAAILYVLWCAFFLVILLSSGFSPSLAIGEISASSSAVTTYQLEQVSLSPYHLLPFKRIWYKVPEKEPSGFPADTALGYLEKAGAVRSVQDIPLPDTSAYPHVYFLSIDADGTPVLETVF